MRNLKLTLRSEGGYYIHAGLCVTLVLFAASNVIVLTVCLAECLYLMFRRPVLLALAWMLAVVIVIRIGFINGRIDGPVPMPFEGEIAEVGDACLTVKNDTGQTVVVYDIGEVSYEPGWIIRVDGRSYRPDARRIPHVFDVGMYRTAQGVSASVYAEEITVLREDVNLMTFPHRLNMRVRNRFDGHTEDFIRALVLGDNSFSDEENGMLRSLNIAHLFALSGMHVGLMVMALRGFFRSLHVREDRIAVIVAVVLAGYAWLTGFSVTMVRAIVLYVGVFVIRGRHLPYSKLDITVFTYLAFLVVNPFWLRTTGFQLSFLVITVILLSNRLFRHRGTLTAMIGISVLATGAALPIVTSEAMALNLAFIPANMMFTPFLSFVLLPATFVVAVCPWMSPVYEAMVDTFLHAAGVVRDIDLTVPVLLSGAGTACLYWMIFTVVMMRVRTAAVLYKRMAFLLFTVVVMSLMPAFRVGTRVIVFDVNQGDAIFIDDASCTMLIDTGEADDYDSLITFFSAEKIKHLDAMVLTHAHADHVGEADDLMRHLTIGRVFTNDEDTYPGTILHAGDRIACGRLQFSVIHGNTGSGNENNNSLVLLGDIGDETWLFAADIEREAEAMILERGIPPVDVLKVAHHGSMTSSSPAFLEAIKPKTAIVSVGKNNRYGMPDPHVTARLARTARVFRTDQDGTLMVRYLPGEVFSFRRTMREKGYPWNAKIP